jgi:signal transduction histidine kinase
VELDLLGQKPSEPSAQFRGRIQELSAQVKQLSSFVHDLSHQLHPAKLEQFGLLAALRGLCKELTQSNGLSVEFTHHEVPDVIPEDSALCLYRIAQEALQNVIKHSAAHHADVELSGSAGEICLRIVDDGAGFDSKLSDGKGGLGLVSMRERLRLVGGAIVIDSQLSGGTRIDVRVPRHAGGQSGGALKEQPAEIG